MRRERSQLLATRMQQLPAEPRGELILLLFGNAVLTVALQASWLALMIRAGRAVTRQGDYRSSPTLRSAWSPALGVVTGALIVQHLSKPLLLRGLDRWTSRRLDADAP